MACESGCQLGLDLCRFRRIRRACWLIFAGHEGYRELAVECGTAMRRVNKPRVDPVTKKIPNCVECGTASDPGSPRRP
jgi:hypothetical protein